MKLLFKSANTSDWNQGVFDVVGLNVSDDSFEYAEVTLILDGVPYDESSYDWKGQKPTDETIFEQVINSYLIDSPEYTSFSSNWKIFNPIKQQILFEGDLMLSFPKCVAGEINIFNLDLATPLCRYYSCGDLVMMLDSEGDLISDNANFYDTGITEDVTEILKGNLGCLYMGDNVQSMVDDFGGKDAWLADLDT
jgi:hypothetical protein